MKINAPFDRGKVSEALDTLAEAVRDDRDKVAQLIDERYDDLKGMFGARVAENASRLRERSRQVLDEGRRQVRAKARELDYQVKRHPWTFLGTAGPVALAAGLFVGYLVGKKRY